MKFDPRESTTRKVGQWTSQVDSLLSNRNVHQTGTRINKYNIRIITMSVLLVTYRIAMSTTIAKPRVAAVTTTAAAAAAAAAAAKTTIRGNVPKELQQQFFANCATYGRYSSPTKRHDARRAR